MKIEKLRNNHKKEIIIGTILIVVIGGALTFKLTHSKYMVTQSIDLGSGVINYKVPDFKIMAMYQQKDGSTCTNNDCYDEITDRMPSSGYVINESKSYCTLDNVNHDNEVILKTENGEHLFKNLKKSDKCYLYFDKQILGSDQILANITLKTTTPDFSQVATTNDGVYGASDGMYGGTTYYWRGAVENNHLIFANKCWRIIRINGDNTIRLTYNGTPSGATCPGNGKNANSIAATSSYISNYNKSNYVGWTYSDSQRPSKTNNNGSIGIPSNAKTQTETWYINNLESYKDKIADGKFCNDRETRNGYTWAINGNAFYYAAYGRLNTSKSPTFNCTNSGDIYTLKVGAITAVNVNTKMYKKGNLFMYKKRNEIVHKTGCHIDSINFYESPSFLISIISLVL